MTLVRSEPSTLPLQPETVAEMRELYRAAESRSARMRLLSVSGQELAEAEPATIAERLQQSADRLAFFLGSRSARMCEGSSEGGIVIMAPGPTRRAVGHISIDGVVSLDDIPDAEDREAASMHLDLMGATIDRIERERERGTLLAALRDREHRLERMIGKIFSAQEDERRRVSQELHDGVAQTATALVRLLEGSGTAATDPMPAAERSRLAGIARDLVKELRAVIGGLRPTLLDDLGLQAALQSLADGLEADGYRVSVRIDPDDARLPAHIETALFRVAQEALANVRKHAGGPCAVSIELTSEGIEPVRLLRIRDSGCGPGNRVDAEGVWPRGKHIGLDVMRERMTAIGGELEWRAGASGGVTITARLPQDL